MLEVISHKLTTGLIVVLYTYRNARSANKLRIRIVILIPFLFRLSIPTTMEASYDNDVDNATASDVRPPLMRTRRPMCRYIVRTNTHTPFCGYGLSSGPTDGLSSWWSRNRSTHTTANNYVQQQHGHRCLIMHIQLCYVFSCRPRTS